MKHIIFSVLFVLICFSGFSQNVNRTEIRDKSQFLTNELVTLLSLDTQQEEKIVTINRQRFIKEKSIKQRMANSERYQKMKVDNFSGEKAQEALTKINEGIQILEGKYDTAMRSVLSSAQYDIYLTKKANLLQLVVDEFGE